MTPPQPDSIKGLREETGKTELSEQLTTLLANHIAVWRAREKARFNAPQMKVLIDHLVPQLEALIQKAVTGARIDEQMFVRKHAYGKLSTGFMSVYVKTMDKRLATLKNQDKEG